MFKSAKPVRNSGIRRDPEGNIIRRTLVGSATEYKQQKAKELSQKRDEQSRDCGASFQKKRQNRYTIAKQSTVQLGPVMERKQSRDPSMNSSMLALQPRKNEMKEKLGDAFKEMISDKQLQTGTQDLHAVRKAAERRLRRAIRQQDQVSVSNVKGVEQINYAAKPNFLVNRSQQKIQSLYLPQENYCDNKSVPVRILLKETRQERVLQAHEVYSQHWDNQQVNRLNRYAKLMEPVKKQVRNAMSIESMDEKRKANHIRKNTGKFCGTKQRVSLLAHSDQHLQVAQTRDTVARSRQFEREQGVLPDQIWYQSLRNSSAEGHHGDEFAEGGGGARSSFSTNEDIEPRSFRNMSNIGQKDMPAAVTFSIPIRKAQKLFMARGSTAAFGQRDRRPLVIGKPAWNDDSRSTEEPQIREDRVRPST